MLKYSLRRILYMFPTLFGVTLITFLLFHVAGGDPAVQAAGKGASAEQIEQIRNEMGLSGSLPVQYFNYLKQIATFDFGRSWNSRQEITTMMWSGVSPTLSMTVPAFLLSILITVSLGLLVAYMRGRWLDRSAIVICLGMLSISSLVYILGGQYFLAYQLDWFPISGWDSSWDGRWAYLGLPILIFVLISLGNDVLFFRTVFLDEMYQDYVRTARAKGLGTRTILFKHILRNALIPIITMLVIQVPFLIVGSLLLENFFGIPGLGGMMVYAIQNADFPVVKAMVFILSLVYMFFSLLSDLLYAVVDPKVQLR